MACGCRGCCLSRFEGVVQFVDVDAEAVKAVSADSAAAEADADAPRISLPGFMI